MMNKVTNIPLFTAGCLVLLLSSARLFYALPHPDELSFHYAYSQFVYNGMSAFEPNDPVFHRPWGPVFTMMMDGITTFVPEGRVPFTWRLLILSAYAITIYFILRLLSEFQSLFRQTTTHLWGFVFIFLALQSTAAIYTISSGGGDALVALSIVGHYYYFCRKNYLLAAIFVVCGIYFKLHPLVFAFPYLIFSLFSKRHRQYALYLALVGATISLISLPVQGWKDGLLYPFSMLVSIATQPAGNAGVPIWSKEVFALIVFVNKTINGFQVAPPDTAMTHLVHNIARIFTILFIAANAFAGWKLSRLEHQWQQDDRLRFLHLFIFQVIVGFIFLTFSLDLSIEFLLLGVVSLFSPLFLLSAHVHKLSDVNLFHIKCMIGFLIGLCFVGGLFPLGILNRILPLNWIHLTVGSRLDNLSLYEKYIWYHVPMFGIYILAFVSYYSTRALLVVSEAGSPKCR
tara:strand:+ start:224 stop:1594 length:1371 start_codon:yes stop_codon:yes gene_type:complete